MFALCRPSLLLNFSFLYCSKSYLSSQTANLLHYNFRRVPYKIRWIYLIITTFLLEENRANKGHPFVKSTFISKIHTILDLFRMKLTFFTAVRTALCFGFVPKQQQHSNILAMVEHCLQSTKAFSVSHFAPPVSRLGMGKSLEGDTARTADQ